MATKVIARYESPRGKYWLELTREYSPGLAASYSYKGDGCGGFLGSRDTDTTYEETDKGVITWFEAQRVGNHFPGKWKRTI